jgi:hypothetical protein
MKISIFWLTGRCAARTDLQCAPGGAVVRGCLHADILVGVVGRPEPMWLAAVASPIPTLMDAV